MAAVVNNPQKTKRGGEGERVKGLHKLPPPRPGEPWDWPRLMKPGLPGWYWYSNHPRGFYGWWVKGEYNPAKGIGGYFVAADPNNPDQEPIEKGLPHLLERRVIR